MKVIISVLLLILTACSHAPTSPKQALSTPSSTKVKRGIDPDKIRKKLKSNISNFRYCYGKSFDTRKVAKRYSIIKFDFTIGKMGEITKASVLSSVGKVPKPLEKCLISVINAIKFPKLLSGEYVEVSQPVNFYPKR